MKGKKKIQNKPKDKRESDKQEEKEGTKRRGEREKNKKKNKKKRNERMVVGRRFPPTTENTELHNWKSKDNPNKYIHKSSRAKKGRL